MIDIPLSKDQILMNIEILLKIRDFERSLRKFVKQIIEKKFGQKWRNNPVFDNVKEIITKIKERYEISKNIMEKQKEPYSKDLFDYMEFSQYKDFILGMWELKNAKFFSQYFPSKEIVIVYLDYLNIHRNSILGHDREIVTEDVRNRIEFFINDFSRHMLGISVSRDADLIHALYTGVSSPYIIFLDKNTVPSSPSLAEESERIYGEYIHGKNDEITAETFFQFLKRPFRTGKYLVDIILDCPTCTSDKEYYTLMAEVRKEFSDDKDTLRLVTEYMSLYSTQDNQYRLKFSVFSEINQFYDPINFIYTQYGISEVNIDRLYGKYEEIGLLLPALNSDIFDLGFEFKDYNEKAINRLFSIVKHYDPKAEIDSIEGEHDWNHSVIELKDYKSIPFHEFKQIKKEFPFLTYEGEFFCKIKNP